MQQANRRAKRAEKNAAQEEANQARIAKATRIRLESQTSSEISAIPLTTRPERKGAFEILEDRRSFCRVGELVKVEADTSPGRNRPAGTGYVENARGVGAATILDVRYLKACDGDGFTAES